MATSKKQLAGDFSLWLRRTRRVLITGNDVDVACGTCNACCRSSYFIHVRPDDVQARKQIPKKLLFAAPGLPKGHQLMGYNEHGCCPMFIDNQCSIYAHRPQTCRTYDCRIFCAAKIAPGEDEQALIAKQLRAWKFTFPSQRDRDQHAAVSAAARFLRKHAKDFTPGFVPSNPTQLALLAIEVYNAFLPQPKAPLESGPATAKSTAKATATALRMKAVMRAKAKFDAKRSR